ncbi:TIGR03546 family protein [Litoribacillus peritrichatus]|uniref:DUF2062 domain-containing protein n=1 Tax=Litoribacillus peritrichatus TaxID=718191 RepID=A0ABP7NAU7_9GAMM
MLTIFAKLLKLLNSDQNPSHLALAVCFGLAIGLMPGFSMFLLFLFILVCVFKANLTLFLLVWGLFEGVAYIFDPALHQVGYNLLTNPSLAELWGGLIQSSFWKLTAFNNSLVMGATATILVLWVPVYLLTILFVKKYRGNVQKFVEKFKIVQMLKGSKFYKLYEGLGA